MLKYGSITDYQKKNTTEAENDWVACSDSADIINNRTEYLDLIAKLTEIVKAQGKVLEKIKGRMGI